MATLNAWLRWAGAVFGWTLACALLAPVEAQTLNAPRESAVRAAFLIKFASFVDWPPAALPAPGEPLVIGVIGDNALVADLETQAQGRSVMGRPVMAQRLREPPQPGRGAVQILFVSAATEARLHELLARVRGPVLVVTQWEGALAAGAALNFVPEGGRIRFDASPHAAEARGLKLSSRLLAVARNVGDRAP